MLERNAEQKNRYFEEAAAKTEAELVQIGWQVFFGQTVIGSENKCLGVADHNV